MANKTKTNDKKNVKEQYVPKKLLEVRNLKTYFFTEEGVVKAVNDVSFSVDKGETIGIVGESGCGKSVTSLSIMGLVPNPPGKILEGEIWFKGENLLKKTPSQYRKYRGNHISMIFQEPMTALNPVFTVGHQIEEVISLHTDLDKEGIKNRAIEMLKIVGIPSPIERHKSYPHEMSGGMRQRVVIAIALACNPELLIADEPTTALDVTIQAQILDLMNEMQDKFGSAIMLITHDLAVVAETCSHVAVMYAGVIVETAKVNEIFKDALHPYTQGLLGSIPVLGEKDKELVEIPGRVPNLITLPKGCYFADRCSKATEQCRKGHIELKEVKPGHFVRCILY